MQNVGEWICQAGLDGANSVVVGAAAWESIKTGQVVEVPMIS
ncbi:MAG: hypothetical protein O3A87_01640 [Verrucomicrobia bacterium]|nr:hypothetical protein [Verrucomicrobiota bacterium]MDA1005173.1 hypothetical protein [Verrucomicrobiota bacterium]